MTQSDEVRARVAERVARIREDGFGHLCGFRVTEFGDGRARVEGPEVRDEAGHLK